MQRPFLRAAWRHLAMLNYQVDPALLRPLVPEGTQLDFFAGRCYVSLVGLLFLDVRLRGLAIPFHTHFEDVNLRFYVRRGVGQEVRRGVVFVSQLAPLPAVALLANAIYRQRFTALPMRHHVTGEAVAYQWRLGGRWQGLRVEAAGDPALPQPETEEEYITEHYWGYAAGPRGTVEFKVIRPRWQVIQARTGALDCDTRRLCGPALASSLASPPSSAFLAAGSAVAVLPGRLLTRRQH